MKTTKSRIILFAIALIYNLLLGLYLKDFLVLSQALTAFYLLSSVAHILSADRDTYKGYEDNRIYSPSTRYSCELNLFYMLPKITSSYNDAFARHRIDVLHYLCC